MNTLLVIAEALGLSGPIVVVVTFLAILLIGAFIYWFWLQLPVPEPIKNIGRLIIIFVFGLWAILTMLGLLGVRIG